jgi:hypothetical protein
VEKQLLEEDSRDDGSDDDIAMRQLSTSITVSEVTKAVKSLKNDKAVGVDCIPIELIKLGGETVIRLLCRLMNLFLRYECTPEDWSQGEVTPVLKKATLDRCDPQSYRPITLLTHLSKVYTSILNTRLSKWCELNGVLHEGIGGFRAERSTTDQLYSLYTLCKLNARARQHTYLCFVDFSKAYDNVWRDGLWWKMRHEFNISGKILRVIRQLYDGVQSRYVLNGQYRTAWVTMLTGLRQGCVLSPLLFNLYMNSVCKTMDGSQAGVMHKMADDCISPDSSDSQSGSYHDRRRATATQLQYVRVASLSYADDLVLIADTAEELHGMLRLLEDESSKWRMSLNVDKTRVMITDDHVRITRRRPLSVPETKSSSGADVCSGSDDSIAGDANSMTFRYRGAILTEVTFYTYLGVILQADYQWTLHKQAVITKARSALHMIASLGIRRQQCSVRAALRMWFTLVLPIIDYAVPIWGQGSWTAADGLQSEAAALILRTLPHTSTAAQRGELGWQRMRARRDKLTVAYWCRLLIVNGAAPDRYCNQLYRAERYASQQAGRDSGQDTSPIQVTSEAKAASYGWSEYVHASLIHHQLQHYWDEQDCAVGSQRLPPVQDISQQADSAGSTTGAPRRTRDFFILPLLADWKKAACKEEQHLWQAELEMMSSLSAYRVFKRRLELEAYLYDAAGKVSVSGRRAARDMARLRCGTHELAVSAGRRQRRPGQHAPLPREERVCTWCTAQLQATDVGDAAADATLATTLPEVPVEDEQHVLLHCPQYGQLRAELFEAVQRMTSVKDTSGRTVLSSGPVKLADMLGATGGAGGVLSALSIVAGGLWSRMDDMPRKDEDERFIDVSVRQACKRYVGRVMSSRRQWQRLQAPRRTAHAIRRLQGGLMRGASAQQLDIHQPQLSFAQDYTVRPAVTQRRPVALHAQQPACASPAAGQLAIARQNRGLGHQVSLVSYMMLPESHGSQVGCTCARCALSLWA